MTFFCRVAVPRHFSGGVSQNTCTAQRLKQTQLHGHDTREVSMPAPAGLRIRFPPSHKIPCCAGLPGAAEW